MGADLRELVVVERPGLREHLGSDAHLADVVQRSAEPQCLEPLLVPPEPDRDRLRVRSDARGVRAERGVADLHRGRVGRRDRTTGMSGSRPAPRTLPVDSVAACESSCPGSPRPANTGWPSPPRRSPSSAPPGSKSPSNAAPACGRVPGRRVRGGGRESRRDRRPPRRGAAIARVGNAERRRDRGAAAAARSSSASCSR